MLSPDEIPHAFASCWNAHDMAAFAALFEPDAHFVNVFGAYWRNRQEIEAAHRATHATIFFRSHLSIECVDRIDLSLEAAVQYAQWTLDGLYAPDGRKQPARSGILLLVCRRGQGGEWRVAAAQNTDKAAQPN